jgi:hypothetical protein
MSGKGDVLARMVLTEYGFRAGLFNFADGCIRTNRDTSIFNSTGAVGGGTNMTGYMVSVNFGGYWTDEFPMQVHARTNPTASGQMMAGTVASGTNFTDRASGPAGYRDAAGFVSETT